MRHKGRPCCICRRLSRVCRSGRRKQRLACRRLTRLRGAARSAKLEGEQAEPGELAAVCVTGAGFRESALIRSKPSALVQSDVVLCEARGGRLGRDEVSEL
jgi:hypothetical protein